MFIEFVGPIGAGKSTMVSALHTWLRRQQRTPLVPSVAVATCVRRSTLGRFIRQLSPGERLEQLVFRGLLKILALLYPLYFVVRNPQLALHVLRALVRLPLPGWHRRIIGHLFFQVAWQHHFLHGRLEADEVVVFDEGPLHRAVNLYTWRENDLNAEEVNTYFSRLPELDLVVIVTAPPETCAHRAGQRGLPLRLVGKEQATVDTVLANSVTIARLAATFVRQVQRKFIEIDNRGALADSTSTFHAQLNALAVDAFSAASTATPEAVACANG